jgi:hypothetical protein
MKTFLFGVASVALSLAWLPVAPAMAQSDWTQVAHDSQVNVTFYYSPGSVQRNSGYSTAKWHDTNHPELVFLAQIDCSARTIQNASVDIYDQNGNFTKTVDLSGRAPADPIGPPGTFGSNLAQAIC